MKAISLVSIVIQFFVVDQVRIYYIFNTVNNSTVVEGNDTEVCCICVVLATHQVLEAKLF